MNLTTCNKCYSKMINKLEAMQNIENFVTRSPCSIVVQGMFLLTRGL